MERRGRAVDAGVAGLVFGGTLWLLAARGLGTADAGARELDGLGAALAACTALPLALRRFAPGTVYAVIVAASMVLLYLRYPLDVPLGAAVAGYTLAVACSGDTRPARRWAALLGVALFVPAIVVAYALAGLDVWSITAEMAAWGAIFAGLWIAGDRTRLRRERMGELEERAARSEREVERERRLAAAEERTRIARELHDSAGHAINVILVQAGAARLLWERDPAASRRAISTIEEVARGTIAEIDRLVRALREEDGAEPIPADPAALEELVHRHRAAGLAIAASVSGARQALPRSVTWAAYRILQEALTNAARHGGGSADVAVRFGPAAVEITVTNPSGANGSPPREGHGIVGMRERATLLGGTLQAGLAQGTFRLHARLPYAEAVS